MSKFKIFFITVIIIIIGITYIFSNKDTMKSSNENQKITIKIITNRTDLVDNKLKDLANEYEKINPNINIVLEGIKQPNEILKIRAAVGESGDITIIPTDVTRSSLAEFYEPIDELGFTQENLIGYSSGLGSDDRLHAVNSGIGYAGIIYNKNSFKKAGIDRIPITIDEFYEDCGKLKVAGITPFAINFADEWPLQVYADDFVLPIETSKDINYSNDLINKDLFSDDNGLYYSLKFLRSMKEKGYIEPNIAQSNWSSFKIQHAKGEIGMTFLGSWYPEQLIELGAKKDDIGMFPFPGTDFIVKNNDWSFGISKDCKDSEEVKKLFKWLFLEGKYAEACNVIPAVKENKSKTWFLDELLSYNKKVIVAVPKENETINALNKFGHPLTSIFKEYLTSDNPEYVIRKYNKLWRDTVNNLDKSEKN